jgi:hypothetical protein
MEVRDSWGMILSERRYLILFNWMQLSARYKKLYFLYRTEGPEERNRFSKADENILAKSQKPCWRTISSLMWEKICKSQGGSSTSQWPSPELIPFFSENLVNESAKEDFCLATTHHHAIIANSPPAEHLVSPSINQINRTYPPHPQRPHHPHTHHLPSHHQSTPQPHSHPPHHPKTPHPTARFPAHHHRRPQRDQHPGCRLRPRARTSLAHRLFSSAHVSVASWTRWGRLHLHLRGLRPRG